MTTHPVSTQPDPCPAHSPTSQSTPTRPSPRIRQPQPSRLVPAPTRLSVPPLCSPTRPDYPCPPVPSHPEPLRQSVPPRTTPLPSRQAKPPRSGSSPNPTTHPAPSQLPPCPTCPSAPIPAHPDYPTRANPYRSQPTGQAKPPRHCPLLPPTSRPVPARASDRLTASTPNFPHRPLRLPSPPQTCPP